MVMILDLTNCNIDMQDLISLENPSMRTQTAMRFGNKDVLIDNIPLRAVNEHLDTTDITQHKIGPVNRNSRPSH